MKKLISTLQNIFKIEELRSKILFTIGLLLIYRLGSYVVLPGVDPIILEKITPASDDTGLLGLINTFAGGAFGRASIFALGIMPYISASIVVQLLGMALPEFQKMQKEGESGRNKLNQYTRFLTILITAVQGIAFVINLKAQSLEAIVPRVGDSVALTFYISSVFCLLAGTMLVMWLGEKITDKGIGNGTSLIIMVGIIARLPQALVSEITSRLSINGGGLIPFLIEMVVWLGVIAFTILLVQGVRRIPMQVARQIIGTKQVTTPNGARQYLPLKVNSAGVMPIIFAQAIMFIPATLLSFLPQSNTTNLLASAFGNYTSWGYNLLLAFLIIVFTYFYTSLAVNSAQMAEDMKRNGSFVPGIKPGEPTAEHIDDVLSKITLPGALGLAIVAILPIFAILLGVNSQFAQFFGGTSLLIIVGVVLDTLQQIESHLLMSKYDGLMKSGQIKGRNASVVAS